MGEGKQLIINADDFGATDGVNRGIVDCHTRGVVTSSSLMVTGRAAREAAAAAAEHPGLSVGLHFVGDGMHVDLDSSDPDAVRAELQRQIEAFGELVGSPPTHIDSHHHLHREEHLMPLFVDAAKQLGVPLRGESIATIGGFYAQWEWGVTELRYIGVPFLCQLLRDEVGEGWTELSCHPGYTSPELHSVYLSEREVEIRTLTDPRVRAAIEELGITLRSYADYRVLTAS